MYSWCNYSDALTLLLPWDFQYINANVDAVVPWNGWFQASAETSGFQVYLSIFMQVLHRWNSITYTQTS